MGSAFLGFCPEVPGVRDVDVRQLLSASYLTAGPGGTEAGAGAGTGASLGGEGVPPQPPLAPASLFDNLSVLDECSSFLFPF